MWFHCKSHFIHPLSLRFLNALEIPHWRYQSKLPCGSLVKNLPVSAGDKNSVLDLERSSGEGNGNPLQYSCSCKNNSIKI